MNEGISVGFCDGESVGTMEGSAVGASVGACVGTVLGALDCTSRGAPEGTCVGVFDGSLVGPCDGALVGAFGPVGVPVDGGTVGPSVPLSAQHRTDAIAVLSSMHSTRLGSINNFRDGVTMWESALHVVVSDTQMRS